MGRYQAGDEQLVELARNGEKQAFDALFDRYLAMVRGEARRWGLATAEGDVVQETFLRAYLNLGELRDLGKFASWLRTISHRVCLSEARSRTREETLGEQFPAPREPTEDFELRQFLTGLPPEDREPLYLHYVLGLDTAAGARALGLTPTAFRVRLHRACKRARALARSQQVEESSIMSGQSPEDLARRLLAEAREATWTIPGAPEDWPRFRAKLEQAYQANPQDEEVRWWLGRKLARDGEYREAIEVLRPVWESKSDQWSGITIAWCLDYLGRRDEAIHMYARVAAKPFLSETQRAAVAAGIETPQTPKRPPTPAKGLVELPNVGWSATASPSEQDLPPSRGIDGDVRTRWSPRGDGQSPGMWFHIDLAEQIEGLAGIWLDDDAGGKSIYQNDPPRHCLVSVSRDGEWWKRVGEWRWRPNHYMEAWWEPISARYVLLEQTAYCHPEWWCIYEAHLFRAG